MIWSSELLHPHEYSIMLGRAHYGHALRLPVEEHAIMFAPPRTGKSGLLADIILRYPGPVLSTTTRADIYRNTVHARRALGRVDTFNPQGIGGLGVPSTMTWDPISGCLDVATAIRRADAFALAVSSQGVEDGAVLGCQDVGLLAGLLPRRRVRPEPRRALRAADGCEVGAGRRLARGRGNPHRRGRA